LAGTLVALGAPLALTAHQGPLLVPSPRLVALFATRASTADPQVFPLAPNAHQDQCQQSREVAFVRFVWLASSRMYLSVQQRHASPVWLANTRDRRVRHRARHALPVVMQTRRPLFPTISPAQRRAFCAYLGPISPRQARPCMRSAPRTSFRTARAQRSATRAQRECAPTTTSRTTACSGLPPLLLGSPPDIRAVARLVSRLRSPPCHPLASRLACQPLSLPRNRQASRAASLQPSLLASRQALPRAT